MWLRLLLAATFFWLASGFSSPADRQQLIISGDADRIHSELGAYVEEAVPGEKRVYTVEVANPTSEEITALLYVADAMPAIGGGKDFTLPSDPDFGSAAWYTTPDRSITLQAGETRSFTMELQIPDQLQPGQYVSVIGVYDDHQQARETAVQGEARFMTRVVRKTGLQVVLDYKLTEAKPPEAIPHAAAYTLENGKAFLTILLTNEGGSLSKPGMSVSVKRQDASGAPLFAFEAAFDSIYAGTVASYRAELSRPLPPGSYTAVVKTTLGDRLEQRSLTFDVAGEDDRSRWASTPSGNVIQVDEDGIPLHSTFWGWRSFCAGGGLLVLIVFVVALRKRASSRRRANERS
ncbi:DUF916 domain-containing protein [Cohnella fermenti]|uniref:DUF916 domain-containing protein n=1 Tax=Cohnella fermenti TaxID=2565925 RepID=A0A4S4BIE7_9BACL|nr:DUF916 domain-containing protein [Cohnella fermenti]THF74391.1 DUF916 domain-containing protein [Cohnella fermenti]